MSKNNLTPRSRNLPATALLATLFPRRDCINITYEIKEAGAPFELQISVTYAPPRISISKLLLSSAKLYVNTHNMSRIN